MQGTASRIRTRLSTYDIYTAQTQAAFWTSSNPRRYATSSASPRRRIRPRLDTSNVTGTFHEATGLAWKRVFITATLPPKHQQQFKERPKLTKAKFVRSPTSGGPAAQDSKPADNTEASWPGRRSILVQERGKCERPLLHDAAMQAKVVNL